MSKFPLEPDAAEMRRLVDVAMRRIVEHIETLPQQAAHNVEGAAEYARTLVEPMPTSATPYETLIDRLFDEYIPRSFNAAGPGYLAYIPGGGIFHSAIADLIADAVNRYVGVFAAAPALAQLEANVVRWFCEMVGYPRGCGGVLTSGGSLANFTAIVTAREAHFGGRASRPPAAGRPGRRETPEPRLAEESGSIPPSETLGGERAGRLPSEAVLYCSDQVHHSFQKAAALAGFAASQIREIATDARFCMRLDALREAIESDRAKGLQPFFVVGSGGTTGTGAVDDLSALADIAKGNGMWFHVDGAYGAFFVLTERGRRALRGIDQADSVILDPHKTLFLPFGTGALIVRDAMTLRRAHSSHAEYLPAMQTEDELVDFCEISPELSRDFRGLRVWLPLKMFGIEPFRQQLDEKLDLIEVVAAGLRRIDDIEIVAEPQLSILAFRMVKPGLDTAASNALNRELMARINARQRVMLTPTMLGEDFVIRVCIVSHRTHRDRIDMALEDIRAAVAELT